MKNALIVCTVAGFVKFELNDIKILQSKGYTVHIATNFNEYEYMYEKLENTVNHQVDFTRSPFSKGNIKAYKQLQNILSETNFDIVHCHTPVGGILGRIAAKKYRKTGTKVLYTAHGFHFFKGAPLKNWLMYYPGEKLCSYFTDELITINKEDYALAQKKMKAKRIEYIPGVGVDISKFKVDRSKKNEIRNSLGIDENIFMLLSIGELNTNKNHQVIINAMSKVDNDNVHYYIAGKGNNSELLKEIADKLGLQNRVHLLGYRKDIKDLCCAADMFVFPSFREGLSVSVMEAMSSGLPVVCSRIRGNTDLIDGNKGGYLCDCDDIDGFARAINELADNKTLREKFGKYNIEKIRQFDISKVKTIMKNIY